MCDQNADTDDFEEVNRKCGKEDLNPLGTTSKRYSVPRDALHRADRDVAFAAARIFPELPHKKPLEYRFAVVRQYVEYEEMGAKRIEGKPFRTESEQRLDRAFTEVAAAYDRCESTIRAACTKAYQWPIGETDESTSPTEALRADCQRILEAVRGQE